MKSSRCSCLSKKHICNGIRTGFLISLPLDHEDYLARYVEMDGRGIAMSTAFPSFAKDGSVAVQCKDIEVMNIDYRNAVVYATCDSWFCLGMDEFQNTTEACSRGCGSRRTASWAVRFSAVLRDSEGADAPCTVIRQARWRWNYIARRQKLGTCRHDHDVLVPVL